MKLAFLALSTILLSTHLSRAESISNGTSSLAHPPVSCVEEIAPSKSGATFKEDMETVAQIKDTAKDDYLYAWTYLRATNTRDDKIKAIYDAADTYDMPPVVLIGAMMQESILDNLPLTYDFGNWACGMGQINVNDWCNWANSLSEAEKNQMDWPQALQAKVESLNSDIDVCDADFLQPDFARAFHSVLMSRLAQAQPGAQEYMMDASYATNPSRIQYSDVKTEFNATLAHHLRQKGEDSIIQTASPEDAKALRFEITRNFVENCLKEKPAAAALAYNLRKIFDALPKEIRDAQHFKSESEKSSTCMRTPKSDAYPLHVGWLLADAVYNAGDEILPGVFAYQRHHHISWENFSPQDLIHAIDYSLRLKNSGIAPIGKKEATDHIRGVVSSVTAPGQFIAK